MKGYKFSEKEIKLVEEQQHKLKTLEDKARCSFTLLQCSAEKQRASKGILLFGGRKSALI